MRRTLPICLASAALTAAMNASLLHAQDGDSLVSVWDGVYTTTQAGRGKATFDVSCSRCHNSDLSGSERGPTLVGDKFLSNWLDGSLDALFSFIRDQMPQGSANIVSDESKADILAYILQRNSFPTGTTELTTNGAKLDTIQVLRKGTAPGLQNLSFVQVVGCLEPGPDNRWVLTHSSARPGNRARVVSAGEVERARARALGEDTFTLVSATPFAPAKRQGHKVAAKGLLYRQPGDYRLNVTALETVADTCAR
ncbi:MAG TPA: cytochrome c [Vicinamibacterales bacterium]